MKSVCLPVIVFFFNPCFVLFFIYLFIIIIINFWLCWAFVSAQGLPLVVASGGHSPSRRAGLSPSRPLLLRSTGSRRAGSVVVAHGPSRSAACGILPDQGSNPRPPHWQADSQPLRHQGSPNPCFLISCFCSGESANQTMYTKESSKGPAGGLIRSPCSGRSSVLGGTPIARTFLAVL